MKKPDSLRLAYLIQSEHSFYIFQTLDEVGPRFLEPEGSLTSVPIDTNTISNPENLFIVLQKTKAIC